MPSPRQPQPGPRPLRELPAEQVARVRVVATDVDGTLTRDGELGAEILAAIGGLTGAGIVVIPISGRPAGEVLGLCRYLPGVEFGVAENGLLEIVPDRAPRWLDAPTDLARLATVGEHLNREHDAKLVVTGDRFCRLGDLAFERDDRDADELVRLEGHAAAAGVHLTWSNVHVHLAERRPDKGAGLLRVLAERGLDPAAVATIGDAPNDAGLFEPGRFALTVGTAEVLAQREWFSALPEYVTAEPEVDGFLELSARLLERRSG